VRPVIRGLAVFVLVSLVTAAGPVPVGADSLPNVLLLETADHPENSGSLVVEYHDHAQFTQWQETRSEIKLEARDDAAGAYFGTLWFYLPSGELGVGTYSNTVYPSVDSGRPGMWVWLGCAADAAGSFTVDDIAWDGATLTSLSLSFRCDSPGHEFAGEVRINSNRPVRAHDLVPHTLDFGRVDAGASVTQDAIVSSVGTGTITPGAVRLEGLDAADFDVVDDGCAGAHVGPGGQCIVRVRFRPRDGPSLSRVAFLSLPDDTAMGHVEIEVKGLIRRPTTTTLTSIVAPGLLGVTVTATLDPPAARGRLEWLVNGSVASTANLTGPTATFSSTALCGTYTIVARYLGNAGYAPSVSAPLAQLFSTETWINLYTRPIAGAPDGTVDIEADLYADAFHGYGAVLQLWDETTGEVFATVGTSQILGDTSAYKPNVLLLGHHVIRASYKGIPPCVFGSEASLSFDGPPIVTPPDTAPPRVANISVSLAKGSQLSGANVPVRLTWSGTDNVAVTGYDVQRQVDGGAFGGTVTSAIPSLSSTVRSGHTTSFRIRARDAAGNIGSWRTTTALSPRTYQEPTARWPWTRYTSTSASSGAAIRTSRTGATISIPFVGRGFAWVAPTSSMRGRATLILYGKTIGTVDLASYRAGSQRLVYTRMFANGNHRLVIRVNGTSGRPRVDVDALIVLR
jgi:hypothetical protein